MVFLVVLFLLKNTSILKNTVNFVRGGGEGLTYNTVAIGDLVNKDTDKDGILDWEEPLWGLDPTKTETTPGVPDSSVIKKLRAEQGFEINTTEGAIENYSENLTETEKFSREFFATAAALSQSGVTDQETMDQVGIALAEKMKDSSPEKVFTSFDIKITHDNSVTAVKKYSEALSNIDKKYPIEGNVMLILQKFILDANNVDSDVLREFEPMIKQAQNRMNDIIKTSVPSDLAQVHLNMINAIQRLIEDLSALRLFDTDPIVAMSAISKYENDVTSFESAFIALVNEVNKKLSN